MSYVSQLHTNLKSSTSYLTVRNLVLSINSVLSVPYRNVLGCAPGMWFAQVQVTQACISTNLSAARNAIPASDPRGDISFHPECKRTLCFRFGGLM